MRRFSWAAPAAAAVAAVLLACHAKRAPTREFDGTRAFGYVQAQMAFGPRIPGTSGHDREAAWLDSSLRARADTVIVQEITHRLSTGQTLHLKNFFARFQPAAAERVLYLAHWDTRPHADQETDPVKKNMPVPGADDGASGVAVLLGVADALHRKAPALGVDLLFVDGEDYGDFADTNDVLIGSRWFAAHQPAGYPPLFAILFDMVGQEGIQIHYEGNSAANAPEVVDRVWRTADSLGYGNVFIPQVRTTLIDDHVALQKAGIHAIDVVDFDYPHWHKVTDTIDKVSAASLQIVGDVAVALAR
ncbi:MAG TPA: M28 family peptidase [Gemmatimonadales bacterium]|nr:M28 family peptidase [Gemmatimonadales bacterium]